MEKMAGKGLTMPSFSIKETRVNANDAFIVSGHFTDQVDDNSIQNFKRGFYPPKTGCVDCPKRRTGNVI